MYHFVQHPPTNARKPACLLRAGKANIRQNDADYFFVCISARPAGIILSLSKDDSQCHVSFVTGHLTDFGIETPEKINIDLHGLQWKHLGH